jgi:hypothetical protein
MKQLIISTGQMCRWLSMHVLLESVDGLFAASISLSPKRDLLSCANVRVVNKTLPVLEFIPQKNQ